MFIKQNDSIHKKNTHKFQIEYFLERLKIHIAEYVEVVCVLSKITYLDANR